MELAHSDGKLRVHYSDRLVTLLREVRQLSAFGYTIPAKIQQTAATAAKFYKHGIILKQVWLHVLYIQGGIYAMLCLSVVCYITIFVCCLYVCVVC